MQKEIAFCLFKYFPYGGLQRDFLRIAKKCQNNGASVRVYTMSWEGEIPEGFDVRIVPKRGLSNHGRAKKFAANVSHMLSAEPADLVVGFNKMPGLDIYFASDICLAREIISRNKLCKFLPRYRDYLELEQEVFGQQSKTRILLLSEQQVKDFKNYYSLDNDRFILLPPGLDENFKVPENYVQIRNCVCDEFKLNNKTIILLHVGSDFKRKGVARAIRSIAALPDALKQRCLFLVAGKGKTAEYQKLANGLEVGDKICFLGVRQDIPDLMTAADVLLHPAKHESAGMILVEALASSLPVLCTAACGYSSYVANAHGGVVLNEPFDQQKMNEALKKMLADDNLDRYRESIKSYCKDNNLGGLDDKAAQYIMGALE